MKRWMKRIAFALLTAAVTVLSLAGFASCAKNDLTFQLSADGTYYILTDCPEDKTEVSIPESYQDKPVRAIEKSAFFELGGLTSVSIPDTIAYIESGTFADCPNLQYTEKENAYYLGNEKNPYVYLVKAVTPDVTEIGIENACKVVDSAAFRGCANLQYTEKGNAKYLGNEDNPYFCLAKALSTDIENVTIDEGCKVIADYAFNGCKNLQGVSIPAGVIDVGRNAFYGCTRLKSATLSNGVMGVGYSAFSYCGLTSVSLPNSLISIKEGAFSYCQKLTSVRLPDSITSIDAYTFQGCYQLSSVTIGKNVTSIYQFAFSDSGLRSVTIPDGVKTIGFYAFSNCGYMKGVSIPKSVTTIGSNAFANCSDLASISFNGTKAEWAKIAQGGMWGYGIKAENVTCTDGIVEIK